MKRYIARKLRSLATRLDSTHVVEVRMQPWTPEQVASMEAALKRLTRTTMRIHNG